MNEQEAICAQCGEHFNPEDMECAYNKSGRRIQVCEECLYNYYSYCDICNEGYHKDIVKCFDDTCICESCLSGSKFNRISPSDVLRNKHELT